MPCLERADLHFDMQRISDAVSGHTVALEVTLIQGQAGDKMRFTDPLLMNISGGVGVGHYAAFRPAVSATARR